jgi:hypothetical protein
MDTIEFVIAPQEFPDRTYQSVEPVINGLSLVEIVSDAGGGDYYAIPDYDPVEMPAPYGRPGPGAEGTWTLLGCGCGDAGCDWVRATVEIADGEVRWTRIHTVDTMMGGGTLDVGPFVFDEGQYESALRTPTHADKHARSNA